MMTGRSEWSGFYYDGRTAERLPVSLFVEAGWLRVQRPDGTSTRWPYGDIRQTQGSFSSEQVRVEYGTDPIEVVLVNQPGFLDEIRRVSPEARQAFRKQRNTAKIVAWSVAIIASAVALYAWGAPIAVEWAAARVPVEWEEALGRNVVDRLAPASKQCGDSVSMADLRSVLDRLVAARPGTPYRFQLSVVRDTMVNAFAAPGGFVVVNSGLLAAATTPEELAGVLAHEVQHVLQRHSTRGIIREVPVRVAIGTLASGTGIEAAAGIMTSLGALRYRRGDETEADREGMRLMQDAEVDPNGMVAFMRTLETKGRSTPRVVSYLLSHPQTTDRVAALEELAKRSRFEPRPLLDAERWELVRHMCDPRTG
jgi:predicted Zn-dependent protease